MAELYREKCIACRRDSPVVTAQEIADLRPLVPDWELVNEDVPKLDRTYRFPDFRDALAFTSALGEVAEGEGHHPRIVTEWGRVEVTWWTHKIRNLHRNDFIMAAKTDQLYSQQSRASD